MRHPSFVILSLATALAVAVPATAAKNAKRKRLRKPSVTSVDLPPPDAEDVVIVPFRLLGKKRLFAHVQVEYGIDRNDDGVISDGTGDLPSEYEPATFALRSGGHSATVALNKRGEVKKVRYRAFVQDTAHLWAWDAGEDVSARLPAGPQTVRDEFGRPQEAFDPTGPRFQQTDPLPGARLRFRASKRKNRGFSEWVYSQAFTVDTLHAPVLTLDDVELGVDAEAGRFHLHYALTDDDGEDRNGNGVLDTGATENEDRNGNGILDEAPVNIAVDYAVVDPLEPLPAALDTLDWRPAFQDLFLGDPATARTTTVAGAAAPREWTYTWDARGLSGHAIIRLSAIDEEGHVTDFVYSTTPLRLPGTN